MIPIQLTIKGLYSYARSVTIDFQPLVGAKLFGIFGPVGSGKSAIIEAIMFVLFDRTTRLNKVGDDRYYNMMNLQSNEMSIDFIFNGGRNHKNKYRFYFLARRSSRDFQKVEVKDRSYYQWSKSDWKPLKKPDVLDMTYENFMQTVIIPQGKFREFIDQKPTARTQMLKELFHLDHFDIAAKAFQFLGTTKNHYSFLEGQLSQFDEINKTLVKKLTKEISGLSSAIEKKSAREADLVKQVNEMQVLKHLYSELAEASETLSALESDSGFYQQKQHQLNRYLKVRDKFRDRVQRQKDLLEEAKSKKAELQKAIELADRQARQVAISEKAWKYAQDSHSKKGHLQQQIEDLKLLIQLKDVLTELDASSNAFEQLENEIRDSGSTIKSLDHNIENARTAAATRSEAAAKLQKLSELQNWWRVRQEKEEQLQTHKSEISQLTGEINSLKIENAEKQSRLLDMGKLRAEIKQTQQELQTLLVQIDWGTHARHLEEGRSCPLCGSIEHPRPFSATGLDEKLDEVRNQLQQLEESRENQVELVQQLKLLSEKTRERQTSLNGQEKKYKLLRNDLDQHLRKYPQKNVPAKPDKHLEQEVAELRQIVESSEKDIKSLDANLKQRQKLAEHRDQQLQKQQALKSIRQNFQGKTEQISGMIKILNQQELLKKTKKQLQDLQEQLEKKLKTIDQNYQQALSELTLIQQQLNQQKGLLKSLENRVSEIKASFDQIEADLQRDCKKESFKGLIEVQNILALDLDVQQEGRELEKYRVDLNSARVRQQSLRKKMGRKQYHEVKHLELNQELNRLKTELKELEHQLSSKQLTHEQYLIKLQKKDSLKEEIGALAVRKDHIQEICNLLRGNGFINFISSVYLQNLCKAANERFVKLTGNRLSLELNQQNEFMVRDHLNEGKLRLLKTLSGGQIFQASLSLALSLAENVKSLNQADQSFFFLDEGFGSLDRASLQLVFQTLKTLRNENRVVGIISHVEDLQLEIDTYLKVRQDTEKGSLISCSWE